MRLRIGALDALRRCCCPLADLRGAEHEAKEGNTGFARANWIKHFGRRCAAAWFTAAALACVGATAGFATARTGMGYVFLILGIGGMTMFFRVLSVIISEHPMAQDKSEWDD